MRDHQHEFNVRAMCRVFGVHPSGFYTWPRKPLSERAIEDQRLLVLIQQFHISSGGTYGARGFIKISGRPANAAVRIEWLVSCARIRFARPSVITAVISQAASRPM